MNKLNLDQVELELNKLNEVDQYYLNEVDQHNLHAAPHLFNLHMSFYTISPPPFSSHK